MTSLPIDFPGLREEARRLAQELADETDDDLPPDLSAEAHAEAQRRGVPVSHIVAEWAAIGRSHHD